MKIKFCGAATGVTGSCHMITSGTHKILLDCGQFQGGKAQEALNYEEFPFDPAEIECVVLSHAHIDHCGRLPLLMKKGFKGKIYCTEATADLLDVMLKDSGYIHEKEAEWQNRKNERAGRPLVEPLYTFNDAVDCLKYIQPVLYDQLIDINDDMKIVFNDAGHILGSAITELWTDEGGKVTKLVFSGDLGATGRPILRDPTIIKKADYVIMETTYGNRLHPENSGDIEKLIEIIVKTAKRGGIVVIPSFAVGRTQELIYQLNRFYEENNKYRDELERLNVYVDSPMATTATEVFRRNADVFDEETKAYILKGDNPLDFKNLKFTRTTEESQALNFDRQPKIIISASGMCEAGRIRHHLKHNLWDPRSSVIFVGYQAEGTLGRNLLNGLKDVTLFGETIHVNAEIYNLEGFSGHADKDGLMEWLKGFQVTPKQLFLVHGELESKEAFAASVKQETGYDATIVREVSEYELESGECLSRSEALADAMDEETIEDIRRKVADVHEEMEKILYNTRLLVGQEVSPEQLANINNVVRSLEKDAMQLSTAVIEPNDNSFDLKVTPKV
ncbi:MAG: MBL fold metallo-hydrolase [Eubacteriaceae bacterium]|jgi:metallo-beta-lactamase family protein|nr:MBL fold metallo-hydrolase [Eubacteriaceae bacterium]